ISLQKFQQKALKQTKQKKSKSAEFLMVKEERAATEGIENPAFNISSTDLSAYQPSEEKVIRHDKLDSTLAAHQQKLRLHAHAEPRGNEYSRNYFDPLMDEEINPRQCGMEVSGEGETRTGRLDLPPALQGGDSGEPGLRAEPQSTPSMPLTMELAPAAETCGEQIAALPWALALCCHCPAALAPALPICPTPRCETLSTRSAILSTWLSVPCLWGSPAGLHRDPASALHLVGVGRIS
uniref:Orofacial cleft 1 candidate 1 n=1 Tax=Crocodylus porosus TaxID=8502 RepID=A0A7M4E0P3_CROPO